ncbi:DNA topoisomerase [Clostridium sp. 'White wine YQ']|uniref:DNA topoisomerase n=1 Tax=Clostridium sp. 'White wine YQ' TaxID=3027474 RepID=UPI00236603E8|nr:DNA topoisomerase [Clostridium sp. 'White wine YQ']MDD7794146.1 DNA topoisomerase [Clostridium sp. 'White wine YQ']
MGKALFVMEKPSVAMDYYNILKIEGRRQDGYIEGEKAIFTWCVGHMVTMSYPEKYDDKLKFWNLEQLPFLPKEYLYEVIPSVSKQFEIVKGLLNREDVDKVYVCTDSGREGEYIYRLVDHMAGNPNKEKFRVWIDSQTEEEIKRGIKEAKPLEYYDSLGSSAYLRAKEDYLLGINFSRLLTLIYARNLGTVLKEDRVVIAVGRVMTCVLAMVVDKEREIREFVKTPFFKVNSNFLLNEAELNLEWKVYEGSTYFNSPLLYNETGFKDRKTAEELINRLKSFEEGEIVEVKKTKETKNPPLLFNLAELQNECTKKFKISPDETLGIAQKLYEKKMLTYPRTDARVLSKAVAKDIGKNLSALYKNHPEPWCKEYLKKISENKWSQNLVKSKYVDDSKITDHYAIIPTGEYNASGLTSLEQEVYELVIRRFLSIFFPPAKYNKTNLTVEVDRERFNFTKKILVEKGYLEILGKESQEEQELDITQLKKGRKLPIKDLNIKEGETTPPKRYTTGSIIIAMENAGKLIEDDELREQIKGSGIGTSATRAEIIKKLIRIEYLTSNNKTQILTPTKKGEMIYEVIKASIPSLLNPTLTASWEKGLGMVYSKEIAADEFMEKLEKYTENNISKVIQYRNNILYKINTNLLRVKKSYENN